MSNTSYRELRTPKPVIIRAVQPPMPITVIQNRFLYRNRLRMVTFQVKDIRFHTGRIRSSSTRRPGLGLLGRMSWAGTAVRAAKQVAKAVPVTHSTAAPTEKRATSGSRKSSMSPTV